MVLPVYFFFFFFSNHVLPLSSTSSEECPSSIYCGNLGELRFPFTTPNHSKCGMLVIHGCEDHNPNATNTVQFSGKKFQVRSIDPFYKNSVFLIDTALHNSLDKYDCDALCCNITLPPTSALGSFQISPHTVTFYICNIRLKVSLPQFLNHTGCGKSSNQTIFFRMQNEDYPTPSLKACPRVQLPVNMKPASSADPFTFIASEFSVTIQLSDDCLRCYNYHKGICLLNSKGAFYCSKYKDDQEKRWVLMLGLIIGGFGVLALVIIFRHYKQKQKYVRLRSANHYLNEQDPDGDRLFFGVPIFSYMELQDATNNFEPSNKLGDGGFGSVYYGKLQDGREVAVKHLFNHNYKQVEQFMTEVEILTRLRHRNLVSLFGCTSRQSRELLLVYEYIPNGTLASHLYGGNANPALLTWPLRIKIAIETATALSCLHASDIIHCDVKTNNILLDKNLCVKVADFGLSRLFPDDVSHVSTAPQGTPGYLDPEYHYCFRLTNKSDVYSFGVVLMELISSKPAVDMTRNKDEITLANLALRKIQKNEFEDLVDPCLGIDKDSEVKKKVGKVGELAFQCLQIDKEMRPSIEEVLEALGKIESGKEDKEAGEGVHSDGCEISKNKEDHIHTQPVTSKKYDQAKLFKSASSPTDMIEKWKSGEVDMTKLHTI